MMMRAAGTNKERKQVLHIVVTLFPGQVLQKPKDNPKPTFPPLDRKPLSQTIPQGFERETLVSQQEMICLFVTRMPSEGCTFHGRHDCVVFISEERCSGNH